MNFIFIRDLVWGLFWRAALIALLFALLFCFAAAAVAEEIYPEKEWVWGCQIKGRTMDGQCRMQRFTKVGETENDVDTDEPRVVGFVPGNVPISKSGKPIWSRIPASSFMNPGTVRLTNGTKCACPNR